MELVNLSTEKLDAMKAVIDLEYIEGTGDFAAKYFPVQVVYINRQTMRIMNPHTYQAMKAVQPESTCYPCLLVDIPADDEIGAAIVVSGGVEGMLSAIPANADAEKRIVSYIEKTFATEREQLFGLGPDADFWLDFLELQKTPAPTNEPITLPKTVTLDIPLTEIEADFPTLDINQQATKTDIQGLQWVSWGSQSRAAAADAYHFYVDDTRFSVLDAINCKVATEPNYSANELTPLTLFLADLHKRRTINLMFQHRDIKTLVDLNIPHNLMKYAFYGVPRGWTAYSNKYYKGDTGHLLDAYHMAQKHAGTDDILYIVFGSEGVKTMCIENNWTFVNVAWRG